MKPEFGVRRELKLEVSELDPAFGSHRDHELSNKNLFAVVSKEVFVRRKFRGCG